MWMNDAEYEFKKDSAEKKNVARSSRSTRTHCGKRGAVKFPSDYMTKKELKAMNGECVSYKSLKEPMTFEDFKKLPKDLQKEYITYIRETFGVGDTDIAGMMGASVNHLKLYIVDCGLHKFEDTADTDCKKGEFNMWAEGHSVNYDALTKPMSYAEFKKLPDGFKKAYLEYIDKEFENPPYNILGDMFGIAAHSLSCQANKLGISRGRGKINRNWKKNEFYAWLSGADMNAPVAPVESTELSEPIEVTESAEIIEPEAPENAETANFTSLSDVSTEVERKVGHVDNTPTRCVPIAGDMTFEGTSNDILNTLRFLFGDSNIRLTVSWTINKD